jgi:hypothetical protein
MTEPLAPDRLPLPGDTCAITYLDMFKRAALLFDRINHPCTSKSEVPEEVTFYLRECQEVIVRRADFGFLEDLSSEKQIEAFDQFMAQRVARNYFKRGINVVPLYPSESRFAKDFPPGQTVAYQAALRALPLVSEENLTWDQVLEFRRDRDAVRKYRALRIWLKDGLGARSIAEATDIIQKKLDDYEWAIRKHGLETITGALSSILDSKAIAQIAAGTGIAAFLAGPIWGGIAGGIVLSSQIVTWITDRMIDLEDVKRGQHSEVALIYDARKKFRKYKSS